MLEAAGINKVFLLGHISTDPVCHKYPDYRVEYHFTLVTTECFDKKGGVVEHQEYHYIRAPLTVLSKNGELKKGQLLHVEGKIQTTSQVDEKQVKRYKTEIIARQVNYVNDGYDSGDMEESGKASAGAKFDDADFWKA